MRFFIGCVLKHEGKPLTAREIADRLALYRRTRRYLNNAGSISNLLKGSDGIRGTGKYPETYELTDWEKFRSWLGLPDKMWRKIEDLNENPSTSAKTYHWRH